MPLEILSVQYSPNKKFKAEEYFVPYLHYSLNLPIYPIPRGTAFYRITNIETGEVLGELEDERFQRAFDFEGSKFCMDYRFSGNRPESECCIDLE